jgi:hypothetical protein
MVISLAAPGKRRFIIIGAFFIYAQYRPPGQEPLTFYDPEKKKWRNENGELRVEKLFSTLHFSILNFQFIAWPPARCRR